MLSLASSTVFALALVASTAHAAHSFSHLRRHHVPRAQPAGWATGYLEVYDTYHSRYMAVGCENKHNTSFFDFCCHPLLATETVEKNRPACCAVGATASCPGATTSAPTTAVLVATSTHHVTSSSSAAAPASTSADDEDCDDGDDEDEDAGDEECDSEDDEDTGADDGDDEDCEDEESSTVKATSTTVKAVTSTHAPAVVTPTTTSTQAKPTTTSTQDKPTTTSTQDKPTTTSTTPKPTTTSTKAEPTTTSTTPKATTTKATITTTADTSTKTQSSSGGSFTLGGFGTWFLQNNVAGACGIVHKDTDFVVALQTTTYAKGTNCGRKIRIFNLTNNKSVDGVVADECPTCDNVQSVDMSKSMFEALAALSVGEFSIKWEFLD